VVFFLSGCLLSFRAGAESSIQKDTLLLPLKIPKLNLDKPEITKNKKQTANNFKISNGQIQNKV
jgi:hypothetical protein